MHADAFDRYRAADSPVHRLDPRVKVVITLAFILSSVLLPDGAWVAMLFALATIVVVSVVSRLGPTYALRRSFIVVPFALVAVTVVFTVPGEPLASWPVGPWMLEPTDAGAVRFASIVARSMLSVMAVILLTATTPFPDIAHSLRHLHVPSTLVATVQFAYRYLFVLSDEALRLLRARDARSARLPGTPGGRSIAWRGRIAGHMAGQLFVRSMDRADRVHQAMVARGYSGHILTMNPHVMQTSDWIAAGAALLLILGLQLIARWGGG